MSKNMSNKHYGIIALVFTAFMIATPYNNAYAQYGGGGGPGAFTITGSFIGTGSGQNPEFDVQNIFGIDKIVITFTNDPGTVTLAVLEVTKPEGIAEPSGVVIKYYRVTLPAHVNSLISQATIDITVSKSDLEKFNVDPDSLKLYRYNEMNSMWEEVSMNKVDEDNNNIYYRATTSGFSFFALSSLEVTEEVPPEMMFSETFTVEGFDVPVTLTSGEVESIDINVDEKSINLLLRDVEEDATLTIEIPRGLLDSKNPDGTDTEFSVIVDGDLMEYEETMTDDKRMLTLEVPELTEDVTILGTFVVPEFGIIAMMILAVSIAGTLIVGRRYITI